MPNSNTRSRPYAMAIGTNDFALLDFGLSLSDAFRVADVERFACSDVVEIKRNRVPFKSTIGASLLKLVSIKPVPDFDRPLVRLLVDLFAVARSLKAALAPRLHLLGGKLSFGAGSLSALVRTEPRRSLGVKGFPALSAGECSRRSLGPWGHVETVPSVACPCKPDIFEATYDPA